MEHATDDKVKSTVGVYFLRGPSLFYVPFSIFCFLVESDVNIQGSRRQYLLENEAYEKLSSKWLPARVQTYFEMVRTDNGEWSCRPKLADRLKHMNIIGRVELGKLRRYLGLKVESTNLTRDENMIMVRVLSSSIGKVTRCWVLLTWVQVLPSP